MSQFKYLIKVTLLLFLTSPAFATGVSMQWLDCKSAAESISGVQWSMSPPGGPVDGGNDLIYSSKGESLNIDLEDEFSSFKSFDQTIIVTKQFEGTSSGYFHLYINANTQSVYLDINITSPLNESSVNLEWANTNGLRKIGGLTCKIYSGNAFTSL